ncbi:hypothetical protein AUC43_07005 [Hymenobacter sedentarius]|uniref:VOC domain-containing protein n=1 Tax=Hymenobacter sedentarius TaxID=1411621 RepID=A0A0U4C9L2_9BACT|nr:glyoxalase/bleomycin resistance/dioxygenase family protein [Hymenobacter sedentarius]ALW84857.1 hypothetical protein AUC43_07005 [Hymenobacter sedentarius]
MRITDLHLLTADLAGTEAFYGGQLQLPLLQRTPTAVGFRVGYSRLTFHAAPGPTRPFYHVAFAIAFGQVNAAQAWVAARAESLPYSATQAIADFPNWRARAFYFLDNNGTILECIGRVGGPAGPAEFEAATGLLGVHEIGLVLPDVPRDCEALASTYHVPFYARGPRLADFAALGDEDGLFIASAVGRGWLPTLRPAERHWLKVAFEQDGQPYELEL